MGELRQLKSQKIPSGHGETVQLGGAGVMLVREEYGEGQQDEHDTLACGRGGQFAGIGNRD